MNDRTPSPLRELLEPPPHVPRRCGARARTTGAPCRKWACIGRSRCRLHGGARGSGRPATSGKHTAQALRVRHFMHLVRRLLALTYRKPEPIDPPAGSYDTEAVLSQTILAFQLAAMSASRAASGNDLGSVPVPGVASAPPSVDIDPPIHQAPTAPESPSQPSRRGGVAPAALATWAPERALDEAMEAATAVSDTASVISLQRAPSEPSTRRTRQGSRP
jgi:glucans biosynthesis protein